MKFLDLRHLVYESLGGVVGSVTDSPMDMDGEKQKLWSSKKREKHMAKILAAKRRKLETKSVEVNFESQAFELAEKSSFDAAMSFILKNSESVIRPFLLKLFNWASAEGSTPRKEMTFFSVLNHLSMCLKGLMLLFIPAYVAPMKEKLEISPSSCENIMVVELRFIVSKILSCLTNTMAHDINAVLTTHEMVSEFVPLIANQWKHYVDADNFEAFSDETVSPCIAQMMLACRIDDTRNLIHRQVLALARHPKVAMRKAMLRTIQMISNRLMEEYSTFYPEAVPVLAELKEDSNQQVEIECDETLRVIEKVVGEAVYEHFPRIE